MILLQGPFPDPTQGNRGNTQEGGNDVMRNPQKQVALLFQELNITFFGRIKNEGG